jgi:hypothetical protein
MVFSFNDKVDGFRILAVSMDSVDRRRRKSPLPTVN